MEYDLLPDLCYHLETSVTPYLYLCSQPALRECLPVHQAKIRNNKSVSFENVKLHPSTNSNERMDLGEEACSLAKDLHQVEGKHNMPYILREKRYLYRILSTASIFVVAHMFG